MVFWALLAMLSLLFSPRIPSWRWIILADFCAIGLVGVLACSAYRSGFKFLRFAHEWAAFPLVIFTYKQLYFIISPLHQYRDYDAFLAAIDRWIFGCNPTQWLERFSNPFLTEILQIAYSLFYLLFIAVGLELYCRKELSEFRKFRFTMVYGFFLSYLGYFLLPAVGPRFTLHDFSRIDSELPGLFLTSILRRFVDFCESIPPQVSSAVAQACAQRDVFPSGHTMMTLMVIIMAFRYRLRIRKVILALGILLIIGTVYLRYHYVIDIWAGAMLAIPCLLTSACLEGILVRRSRNP